MTLPISHMTGFEQRLAATVRGRRLDASRPLIVGYSGGADSLALLVGLSRLEKRGIAPAVIGIVVDHRLRPTSGVEADTALQRATESGCETRKVAVDERRLSGHQGVGVEEAARRERFRVLADNLTALGGQAIVLAHHREDQAESVLLHLLRGAGASGASGMAEWGIRPIPWWRDEPLGAEAAIWRPLLREPRAELQAFVSQMGLIPVEDPSNLDRGFARNAIRLDILPALERIVPGSAAALGRYADLAAEDDAALDVLATEALAGAMEPTGALRWSGLVLHPLAVRRRAAKLWLLHAAPLAEPGLDQVEALLNALERNRGGAIVEIGNGESVIIERSAARALRRPDWEN